MPSLACCRTAYYTSSMQIGHSSNCRISYCLTFNGFYILNVSLPDSCIHSVRIVINSDSCYTFSVQVRCLRCTRCILLLLRILIFWYWSWTTSVGSLYSLSSYGWQTWLYSMYRPSGCYLRWPTMQMVCKQMFLYSKNKLLFFIRFAFSLYVIHLT